VYELLSETVAKSGKHGVAKKFIRIRDPITGQVRE
jgi:translation elongation factor P/translation initiation factor 5A